jgi:hypothetical protein
MASHGTTGARAAEAAALDIVADGGRLHHLVIVPELWRGMTGDGWRINAATEHEFCDYLESQIERETLEYLRLVARAAANRGIIYSASSECGPLVDCLAATAAAGDYEAVVIGSPRPRGIAGLRSRLDVDKLMRVLRLPLIVIPYPTAGR